MIREDLLRTVRDLSARHDTKAFAELVESVHPSDMAEALEDAFRYGKIVLAASTYNAGIMPFMEDFLHHLKAKNYQKRTVGLMENGSWAPFAVKGMTDILSTMKEITILPETVTLRGPMKESDLPAMEALASALV